MEFLTKSAVRLFVDRESRRWVVLDPDGQLWAVPTGDDGWQRREPLDSQGDLDLQAVPGHYRYLFNLPF